MILIEPFRQEHFDNLRLQPAQAEFAAFMEGDYATRLLESGPAFAAVEDGKTLGVAGVTPQGDHRAVAWAVLSPTGARAFLKVHRAVRRYLDIAPYRRIEAIVNHEFEAGHRWMRVLGFQHEGLMRGYMPDGRDCDLYARVR